MPEQIFGEEGPVMRKLLCTILILFLLSSIGYSARIKLGDLAVTGRTGYDVRAKGAEGDGSTDDKASIAAADTAAIGQNAVLIFPAASVKYKISSDITITSVCEFLEGGIIAPDNGITITLSSAIIAGNYQIFDISSGGSVALSNSAANEVQSEWFGSATVATLVDGDTTPSVSQGRIFKTANTGSTTITNFDDGIIGQLIRILVNDANTTFDFSASSLKGNGGSDLLATSGDVIFAIYDGTNWWCSVGSGVIPLIGGTANQVVVTDNGDGSITLSTPQNIHTGATPQFASVWLTNLNINKIVVTDSGSATLTTNNFTSAILSGQLTNETGESLAVFNKIPEFDTYLSISGVDYPGIIFNALTAGETDFWMGIEPDSEGDDDDYFTWGDGGTVGSNIKGYIDTNGNMGIGKIPDTKLEVLGTFRVTDSDDTNYTDFQTDGSGDLTISPSGSDTNVSGRVTVTETAIAGTGNRILEVTADEALNADEHLTMVRINGENLDPDGESVLIRALAINVSDVDLTNDPDLQALRIVTPGQTTEAIHIEEGHVHVVNTLPSTAAATFSGININVDAEDQDATGDYHAVNVSTPSTPGGDVYAVGVGADVGVIHQHTGTFGNMDWAGLYDGSFTDETTEFTTADAGGANDIEVLGDDNDYILIADVAKFCNIRVVNYTDASVDAKLTFHYGDGSQGWTVFSPNDDTSGMSNSGVITYDCADLASWGTDTVNEITGLAGAVNYYWIKITRTKNVLATDPVESIWQILSATEFGWDKDADVTANSLDVNDTNITGEPKHFRFTVFLPGNVYDSDTEVCIVPAIDAAITVSKIEVTLNISTQEITGDLKYADTFIGLASAVVINAFDTTSGVLSDASISPGSVASGKAIYISFDADPHDDIFQACFDITYSYD